MPAHVCRPITLWGNNRRAITSKFCPILPLRMYELPYPLWQPLNVSSRRELALELSLRNGRIVPRLAIFPAPASSRGESLLNGKREGLRALSSRYGINHGIVGLGIYNLLINMDFI